MCQKVLNHITVKIPQCDFWFPQSNLLIKWRPSLLSDVSFCHNLDTTDKIFGCVFTVFRDILNVWWFAEMGQWTEYHVTRNAGLFAPILRSFCRKPSSHVKAQKAHEPLYFEEILTKAFSWETIPYLNILASRYYPPFLAPALIFAMDAIPITKKLIAFGSKKIYLYELSRFLCINILTNHF